MSLISQNAVTKPPTPSNLPATTIITADPKLKKSNKKRGRDEKKDLKKYKNNNNKKSENEKEKEMKRLEDDLFGSLYSAPVFGSEFPTAEFTNKPLFFEDRSTGKEVSVYEEDREELVITKSRKPAWVDEEEEKTKVNIKNVARLRKLRRDVNEDVISGADYVERLRAQHKKLNPGTDWARGGSEESGLTFDDDDDDGNEVLRSGAELVVEGRGKLMPGLLEHTKMNDVYKSGAGINAAEFHNNGQLFLTGGLDKRLSLFQVDGKRNPNVSSIFLDDCPIYNAAFMPNGYEIIVSGRRKFFYVYDLVKNSVNRVGPLTGRDEKSLESFVVSPDSETIAFVGNEGHILLVSAKTKQLIGTLKMNGSVRSLAFAENGTQLLSSGGDGKVYHWDLGTRKCIHVGVDQGSLVVSSICVSPDSSMFCTGSSSGIVNLYKMDEFLGGKRQPLKVVKNLTTEVNEVKFNHDGKILAICSRMKSKAVRLVHVPTGTVFSNWPNGNLGSPRCLDFSPNSGFLTVGNAEGNVLLYKLHHYQNA